MANMIEHSKFVSMHQMKQEWEDDIAAEDEEKTKMGLTKKDVEKTIKDYAKATKEG